MRPTIIFQSAVKSKSNSTLLLIIYAIVKDEKCFSAEERRDGSGIPRSGYKRTARAEADLYSGNDRQNIFTPALLLTVLFFQ